MTHTGNRGSKVVVVFKICIIKHTFLLWILVINVFLKGVNLLCFLLQRELIDRDKSGRICPESPTEVKKLAFFGETTYNVRGESYERIQLCEGSLNKDG